MNKQHERLVELLKEVSCAYHNCIGDCDNECKFHRMSNREMNDLADYLLANNVLVLPHALGSKVWCLGQPCGGCECYNEPMTEEFIERCRKCDKWEIGECDFDYELIPEWGKFVFPTRELAEEALGKKLEEARERK